MKRIFVTAVVAVLTFSVFAWAEDDAQTPKPRPHAGLFAKADADKDGKVTLQELQAVAPKTTAERFKKLDKNNDGALTKNEIPPRPAQPGGPGSAKPPMQALVGKADANQDKKVTLEELKVVAPEMTPEHFAKMDRDHDGVLSEADRPKPGEGREEGAHLLKKADADQSGEVTFDEMKTVAPNMNEARFGELDRNDDGVLTPADFPNAGPSGPDRQELMMKLKEADKDANGDVTFEEAQAAMPKITREKFDKLDRNHDGVVNKADHELKKAEKKAEQSK